MSMRFFSGWCLGVAAVAFCCVYLYFQHQYLPAFGLVALLCGAHMIAFIAASLAALASARRDLSRSRLVTGRPASELMTPGVAAADPARVLLPEE